MHGHFHSFLIIGVIFNVFFFFLFINIKATLFADFWVSAHHAESTKATTYFMVSDHMDGDSLSQWVYERASDE